MKRLIAIFPIMLILFSCREYELSQSDLEWQPYKKGDVLIFESNKGEIDTINIIDIEVYTNTDDPLAVFPNKLQTLFVTDENIEVLSLKSGENSTDVHFSIRLGKNNLKYPCTILSIQDLEKLNQTKVSKIFIEAFESCDNMKDKPFDLRYIYWSKQYGYLGIEFKENYIWNLKSFIRDGKEFFR